MLDRIQMGNVDWRSSIQYPVSHQIDKYKVQPRIEALPKRSIIFLFSDHGFKDNPRFNLSDKYSESRYTHGGNSFWEIIVPLVVLLKL